MMNLRVVKDMLVDDSNRVYATNLHMEGNCLVADGHNNYEMDENGDFHKVTEYVFTEDEDCVTVR